MTRQFKIRKAQFFKHYVFLLSIFDGSAYWSAHEYHGDSRAPLGVLADLFQSAHNVQVEGMIAEALAKEAAEFMELTLEQDKRSRSLIDSLPEEKRQALLDQFEQPLNPDENETV